MIQEKYSVREISHKETYPFLKKIHYAKRVPCIVFSYGLFDNTNSELVGVITFGLPPAPTEQLLWKPYHIIELNRLCLMEQKEKNVLSYFVSQSLRKIKEKGDYVVISYADIDQNHCEYIYQATNWFYTGIGGIGIESYVMSDGKERHSRHQHLIDFNSVKEIKKSTGKHRYYYFLTNRKDKEIMKKMLIERFEILPYPKTENKLYEIKKIDKQMSGDKWF